MHKALTTILLLIFSGWPLLAQDEWIVPEDQKTRLSPFSFNDTTQQEGQRLYRLNCTSCHGDPGKGNYANLDPIPPDPTSAKLQQNRDGELYHKVWEGRGLMPSFKNILTPDETWFVISFLRSFNKEYVQEVAKEIERKGYDGIIEILLTLLPDDKVIESVVVGKKPEGDEPISGAPIKLTAQRYFGALTIDDVKTTDIKGVARFQLPTNLPGDSAGNIKFSASLTDLELYGTTRTDTTFLAGTPTNIPSLTSHRAMWNTMWNAPVWLLITYFMGVAVVWGTIFYIILKMRQIYMIKNDTQ